MTPEENRLFFQEIAFIHFPALATWMKSASIDPVKTVDAWHLTLRDITTEEAISVVYRWSKDELPRPEYLELCDFALHLRGVVLKDRADRRKAAAMDMIRDREETPKEYSRVSWRVYTQRALDLGARRKANEITEGQFQADLKQILEDHDRAYKQTRYANG